MAYYQYSDIDGELVLGFVQMPNISKWYQPDIDLNKTNQGERASIIGMAVLDYDKIFSFADVDRSGFTSFEEADYNASILYYIAHKLKRNHLDTAPADKCSKDDYRQCAIWKNYACEHLKDASNEAYLFANFCTQEECNELPADAFGVAVYDSCCDKWE